MESLSYLVAFSLGLFGSAHCLGMCGGIIGALTLSVDQSRPRERILILLGYNFGRVAGYVLIAVIFYLLVSVPASYLSLSFMRVLAGLLLIAMGFYLADWWRGLQYLEKAGGLLWQKIQPFSQTLLPVRTVKQALLLGVLWGWLPCGLIYSALVYSSTADSVYQAALLMASFAAGTLPAVLFGSLFAENILNLVRKKSLRTLMAVFFIGFGVWTLWSSFAHRAHEPSLLEHSDSTNPQHSH
ncbi:MAG: sulfite exporter TauE/SafE [Cellvibrionaceae bacterium]|jgi:sulfite exporter TauE/SafE